MKCPEKCWCWFKDDETIPCEIKENENEANNRL